MLMACLAIGILILWMSIDGLPSMQKGERKVNCELYRNIYCFSSGAMKWVVMPLLALFGSA
jgi:hypothetical protein